MSGVHFNLWRQKPELVVGFLFRLIDLLAIASGLCLLLGLFWLFASSFRSFDLFSPFDLIEESAYTYTSARNYLRFGLLNSWLLQDFSTSPDPADHPFVYNHMPPGPDLLVAGIISMTGGDYQVARIILAAIAAIGFAVYLLAVYLILKRHDVFAAGIALFILGPWSIVFMMGRIVYTCVPILAFGPFVLFLLYLHTGRTAYFVGAVIVAFLSSLYIEYSLLSALITAWIALFVTQLIPLRRAHIVAICAAFAAGISLHVFQNFWFLGWDLALTELRLTLSNRMTGFPSQDDMKAFYRNIGLVHHGSRPIDWNVIWAQIIYNVRFVGDAAIGLMLILLVLWRATRRSAWYPHSAASGFPSKMAAVAKEAWSEATWLARFILWALACVMAPIALFPAFAQEVNIRGSGAGLFFIAIMVAAVIGRALQVISQEISAVVAKIGASSIRSSQIVAPPARAAAVNVIGMFRFLLIIGLSIATVSAVTSILDSSISRLSNIRWIAHSYDVRGALYDLRRFQRSLFMTNINGVVVGFLTDAAGFGVCGEKSIGEDRKIQLDDCKIAFMRRQAHWQSEPIEYFYYFRAPELFPGFADCIPTGTMIGLERGGDACMDSLFERLRKNYPMIYENKIVHVFSLSASPGRRERSP